MQVNRRSFLAGVAAAAVTVAVVTKLAPVLRWQYWRCSYHGYWHENDKLWCTFTAFGFDEASAMAHARSSEFVTRPWSRQPKPAFETLTIRSDGYL